ncbi:DsbA family oxidoreductase [Natranaeroarchaeum aerophilus]|uniref:DsbA family oxidoreductase n=1 Tax=Natranaeroarchaeum aerophilus TaxID=2917711 RepID=A0AAE3FSC5_9EURY|nr:DsbA family oxidoreductase [Natranaeroarchaeum aerophilus]MCL9814215.1 DsbA family oxidoreductase [Natranaeroarchaeum aerophilus]
MTDDRLTIYSDYVCPFCYLGRKSLDSYQAGREEPIEIDWHPFDLRAQKRGPDGEIDESVDDGKDEAYFAQAKQNVQRLAERYDADMALDLSRDVDSLNAQIASYHVKQEYPYERWLAFDIAILEALWEDGRDIGDPDVLAGIAVDAELDGDEIRAAIEDEELAGTVSEQFEAAYQRGVTGVPTFVYDDHSARGAVPPEQLERLIEGV